MSSTATPPRTPPVPPPPRFQQRARDFWASVSEGLELNQLWSQFVHEARTSYGLYSRELKRDNVEGMRRGQRFWALTKQLCWAVLMKLSPARRVILLVAVVLLLTPVFVVQVNDKGVNVFGGGPAFWGGLLLLLLLVLEIADRVTMKRDLEIAREIQRWLVPATPPQIAGLEVAFWSRPANTVAGDYYDVVPMQFDGDGPNVLLVVADVAGKSLPAALLMATFQASLRTLATTARSLLDLVRGVNRYSCAHSLDGRRFTTAFLARLNPATGELIYTNAGHNAPLLWRASGTLERLDVGGIPLGIQSEYAYECGSSILRHGDMLVIFTDGVVEAVNERGEEYDESRLIPLVERCSAKGAQGLVDSLTFELKLFGGQASQHDDITCMAVRMV
ncbi:MAG: PP2C family protein-serine/threonine phosphatase [Acidobacteriia bacterium]|nr:PP2C family protein-serine/threonine phosphatase [Terriglobia bacterium]